MIRSFSALRRRRVEAPLSVAAASVASLLALTCLPAVVPAAFADDDVAPTVVLDPLQLELSTLTPAVLGTSTTTGDGDPRRPLVLRGTITNVSGDEWRNVNIAPFRSTHPITDPASLSAAAELPATEYVGDRLTDGSAIDTVRTLAPGASAPFTVRIPRSAIGTTPGVYWVGVHASGETDSIARDEISDGRARTFVPVADPAAAPVRSTVLLPLRGTVAYGADGTVTGVNTWTQLLAEGGRLHDLLLAGRTLQDQRTSGVAWLVDPALVQLVQQLALGNTTWSLEPLVDTPDGEQSDPDGSGNAPEGDGADADNGSGSGADEAKESTVPRREVVSRDASSAGDRNAKLAAQEWLDLFDEVVGSADAEVLALPHGDVDLTALARRHSDQITAAQARGIEVLQGRGIRARMAVAPVEGVVSPAMVRRLSDDTVLVLSDRGLSSGDSAPAPGAGTVLGHDVLTVAAGVTDGGPGPEDPGTAIQVRQRLLSETTVRTLNADTSPVVALPPSTWDATDGADEIVTAFSTRLLRPSSVERTVASSDAEIPTSALVVTPEMRAEALPAENVRAATEFVAQSSVVEELLASAAGVDQQAQDVAWSDLSYAARANAETRLAATEEASAHMVGLVDSVSIEGPAVVTLSGSSGRLGATITNDLTVPVEVEVEAASSSSLEVTVESPIKVGPNSRQRLPIEVSQAQQGVTTVTLQMRTPAGTLVGAADDFPVRSSPVSGVLWWVMGGAATLLVGAIMVRLRRKGLHTRRTQGT